MSKLLITARDQSVGQLGLFVGPGREGAELNCIAVAARCMVAALAIAGATSVLAQSTPDAGAEAAEPAKDSGDKASDKSQLQTVVVTGTSLRGIAPVGTNVVTFNKAAVQETGVTSTSDVLARIPQITSNFNKVSIPSGINKGDVTSRPNIRGLGQSGGNTTLVLVDGHRIVNAGIILTAPDADVVPPGVLERIEVVPDGGSSIYGSDAVGGVINLITRKRFDGVELSGRYGFAKDYYQADVNATVGKSWEEGSAYVSYVHAQRDALFGRDRSYVHTADQSATCAPGTIYVNRGLANQQTYRLPDRTPGTVAQCDPALNASLVPDEKRDSVFAGLSHDLSEHTTFDLRTFYTRRETNAYADQLSSTGTIDATNPFFSPVGNETKHDVSFSYAPVFGPSAKNKVTVSEWGITPSVTVELNSNWQLRALVNYGKSDTTFAAPVLNASAQVAALAGPGLTTANAINPYDVSKSGAAALAALQTLQDYGQSNQDMANARLVMDGTVYRLPGGPVKLALGAEYLRESYTIASSGLASTTDMSSLYRAKAKRDVSSAFGELAVPIVGAENRFDGMESLTLSASARYDKYSDFGSTVNPKIGATWKPVSGLSLRANVGKSFNAPSLADMSAAESAASAWPLSLLGGSVGNGASLYNPAVPPSPFKLDPAILVAGGNPDLKPQKANTYSIGFDFKPAQVPGLSISATYWNIDFKNQIAQAYGQDLYTPGLARFVITHPTLAQAQKIVGKTPMQGLVFNGAGIVPVSSIEELFSKSVIAPYLLYDARRNNLGGVETSGVDFSTSYVQPTSFGLFNASLAGSYTLKRKIRTDDLATPVDAIHKDVSRASVVLGTGLRVNQFTVQASLYYSSGFDLTNPAGTQTRVGSFRTIDLFFGYDVRGSGLLKDLQATLSINNVLDTAPPFLNRGAGYTNGSTVGRMAQIGLNKKF